MCWILRKVVIDNMIISEWSTLVATIANDLKKSVIDHRKLEFLTCKEFLPVKDYNCNLHFVLRGTRIVIPENLRMKILNTRHGIV